jgi:nucleoid-associated protein YgaU
MRNHTFLSTDRPSRRQIINKRRYALLFVAILSSLIVLSLSMAIQAFASSNQDISWTEVQVKKGDTLWKLVKENYTGTQDIRKVIYDVRKINNLESSAITPRQWIKIPIE